ncbi:hypothetical protein BSL78_26177 [Apostichopus japonicus]|uniref:SWIM-type domain-containing protein n=1 Tax=Stichopus japonicus TaxID=307972 RepID=A0A2G8JMM6_STIJA|nr:hypothetical protein BSL78_26177 [Apostichopus japonicus]
MSRCAYTPGAVAHFRDDTLPPDYTYHMCMFKPLKNGYQTEFRVNAEDADGAQKWLRDYTESSRVTYRVQTTKPIKQPKTNIFKTCYRCQHNTLPRSSTADGRNASKNTSCPAQLDITVKKLRVPGKRCRAKTVDNHLPSFPMVVKIQHVHNHLIESADTLKFRDVSEATIEIFKNLFSKGHSPSSALNTHKLDLQMEHGADYLYKAADRSICPSLAFCHSLYRKIFDKSYGAASGEKMLHDLEAAISSYNEEKGEVCAKIGETNGKLAIAVCTPMMKRIHSKHEYSGELVFIDTSGGMDRYDCRIFMLLTHSSAGGVPLGCLIVTSESRECVTLALNLYKEIIPDDAFYGNGAKGPLVFLTDDSESERQSLHTAFPEATLILCVFHLLQAMWRYLWEAKNAVRKDHRPHLLFLVKTMTYAKTGAYLDTAFETLVADDITKSYPNYIGHCVKLFKRRKEWAICHREDLPTRGNNTNNYAEDAMRVLKDQIFERVRAYNVVQLLDFLLTRMPSNYERRITDIANGRIDVTLSKKYLPGGGVIEKEMVRKLGDNMFECKSQSKPDVTYNVDMSISVCSCFAGMTGAPCKHQYAIVRHYNVSSLNFVLLRDEKMREHLLFLASGLDQVRPGWFALLHGDARSKSTLKMNHAMIMTTIYQI